MAKQPKGSPRKDTRSRKVRDLPAQILKADAATPARGGDAVSVRGGGGKAGEKPLEYLKITMKEVIIS